MIDAYVITDRPDEVAAFMRGVGLVKMSATWHARSPSSSIPSAGGGRAAKALPGRRGRAARASALGFRGRRARATSTTRASSPRRGAARARSVVDAQRRRAARRASPARCATSRARVLGVLPGGRGNDFARVLGIPLDAEAACDVIADGAARAIDLGEAGEPPVHRDRLAAASTPRPTGSPTRRRRALGKLVYALRRAARAGGLEAGALRPSTSTASARAFTGWSVARRQLEGLRRRHVRRARRRARRRRCSTSCYRARRRKARFLRSCCPRCSRARTSTSPSVHVLRGARGARSTPTARSRVYADGDPIGELP